MKKFGRIVIMMMFALMLATPITLTAQSAKVEAATTKTNIKMTMTVGQKKKLTLVNANGKVKWSVKGSKYVKIVKKSGKYKNKIVVKAKKAGKATITATVGGKKYKCKITVKKKKTTTSNSTTNNTTTTTTPTTPQVTPQTTAPTTPQTPTTPQVTPVTDSFNAEDALNNLQVTSTDVGYADEVVVFMKNNYKYAVEVLAAVDYYDSFGNLIYEAPDEEFYDNWCLISGGECVMTFKVPEEIKDSATSYKVVYLVRQSTSTPYNQNIRIDSVTLGDTALTAQISNIGDTEIKVIYVTAVFYKDGEVIGAKELGIECNNPGTSTTETFYYPYYMEDVVPDDCKLYINYACSY